jgi:hypothetical protein
MSTGVSLGLPCGCTIACSRSHSSVFRTGWPNPLNGEDANIFVVQDLYYGDIVPFFPPDDNTNYTLPGQVTTVSKTDLADPTKFTEMYVKPSRYGYGYGFQDSKLAVFGAAILLLHVVMCLVYVIWILGMGEYRSTGW